MSSEAYRPLPKRNPQPVPVKLAGLSVFATMPLHRDLDERTVESLLDTQATFAGHYGVSFSMCFGQRGVGIERTRNQLAAKFMASGDDFNLMLDSDHRWTGNDAAKLLAKTVTLGCVSAAYVTKTEPMTFRLHIKEGAATNELGCLPHQGLGLGFTMVSRAIIESMSKRAKSTRYNSDTQERTPMIFRHVTDNEGGDYLGEDYAFFKDMIAAGHQPWLDPTITIGHLGDKEYRGSFMKLMKVDAEEAAK